MRTVHSLLLLSLLSARAWAQAEPPTSRWELGVVAGGATQQAYPGANENTRRARAVPYLIYRGDRVRLEHGRISVRALRGPTFELDVGTSGSLGSRASDVKAREGMPDLGDLVEFGPRLTWNLSDREDAGGGRWRLLLPLRGVFDLGDDLAFRGITFEPEIEFSRRSTLGWRYSARLSAIAGSERFNDLYYEVAPAFATPTRPAYDAKAGLITWRLGTSVSRWLTPDWRVSVFARLDHIAGASNQSSPLVSRRSGGAVGIGVQWVFFRSAETVPD